jgi:tetraacyldisaccharide 4'-kinase
VPVRLHDGAGNAHGEPAALRGAHLFVFSGIANPGAFENTLTSLGGRITGRLHFPDHHWYTPEDVERIRRLATEQGAEKVVTTAKDGARLSKLEGRKTFEGSEAFLVLDVEIRFLGGEADFHDLVFKAGTR